MTTDHTEGGADVSDDRELAATRALVDAVERSMAAGFEAVNRRIDDAVVALRHQRDADRERIAGIERAQAKLEGEVDGIKSDLTRGLESIRQTVDTAIREVSADAAQGRAQLHRRIDDLDGPVSGRVTKLENRHRVVAAYVAGAALAGSLVGSGLARAAADLPLPLSIFLTP